MTVKNFRLLIRMALLGLLAIFLLSYVNFRVIRVENIHAGSFSQALHEAVQQGENFVMRSITPFEWDKMYIFRPYTSRDEMEQLVALKWTTRNTYLGYLLEKYLLGDYALDDDSIQGIVFVKDGKVVLECTVMRNTADFTYNEKRVFECTEAKFTIEKPPNNYPLVQQIEETDYSSL